MQLVQVLPLIWSARLILVKKDTGYNCKKLQTLGMGVFQCFDPIRTNDLPESTIERLPLKPQDRGTPCREHIVSDDNRPHQGTV
jgi:hypothetical protein